MRFEFQDSKIGSLFGFTDDIKKNENLFSKASGNINILWNRNKEAIDIEIDGLSMALLPNQLATTTYFQHVTYRSRQLPLTAFFFNRKFYCINEIAEALGFDEVSHFSKFFMTQVRLSPTEYKGKQ